MLKKKNNNLDISSLSHKERQIPVGIDLGTTYSSIAIVDNNSPKIICNSIGETLLPSIVSYQTNGVFVGNKAKLFIEKDPKNTISSIKRFLGRSLVEIQQEYSNLPYQLISDKNNSVSINTILGPMTPVQISSEILKTLITRITKNTNFTINGAVITVPAYFDEKQRQYTKDAANIAGIKVLRLLNEPTAAAIAYGLNTNNKNIIVVYDLGGGTFDVSILKIEDAIFEVLATGGNTKLGGDDFDNLLVQWMYNALNINNINNDYIMHRKMLNLATKAKIKLSNLQHISIEINEDNQIHLSREIFNTLIKPLIHDTLTIVYNTIKNAGIKKNDITKILMVGGSTKIPLVIDIISNFFNLIPIVSENPETIVATGAAIHANILIGNQQKKDFLLLDVIPLSLGLETVGGMVEKIIPRNSKIPIAKTQKFTTLKNNQKTMKFHIVQGEDNTVNKCRSLGNFILQNIPDAPAGKIRIEVTFQIDTNGLLNVTAVEKSTGTNASIQIEPSYDIINNNISNTVNINKNI